MTGKPIGFNAFEMNCVVHQSLGLWRQTATMRPGGPAITTTRSATTRTSSMSGVTSTGVNFDWRQSDAMWSCKRAQVN